MRLLKKDNVTQGVILSADVGYGMKYGDEKNMYLKLTIQMFDGYECVQLFNFDRISEVLDAFPNSYDSVSINKLVHRTCYLLTNNDDKGVPDAITYLPPDDNGHDWVFNNNWD